MNIASLIFVSLFWFLLYWVLGGVLFAIINVFFVTKLRKAQFGCLYSVFSFMCAVGAGYAGTTFGTASLEACPLEAADVLDTIANAVACAIVPYSFAGLVGFAALFLTGTILLYICRARNQSWADGDEDVRAAEELYFDKR